LSRVIIHDLSASAYQLGTAVVESYYYYTGQKGFTLAYNGTKAFSCAYATDPWDVVTQHTVPNAWDVSVSYHIYTPTVWSGM